MQYYSFLFCFSHLINLNLQPEFASFWTNLAVFTFEGLACHIAVQKIENGSEKVLIFSSVEISYKTSWPNVILGIKNGYSI